MPGTGCHHRSAIGPTCDISASERIACEVAGAAMVEPAQARVVVERARAAIETADPNSNSDIYGKTGTNDRPAETVEAHERRAAESDPTAIPAVVCANEQPGGVNDPVGPAGWVWALVHISRPRGIGDIVVIHDDAATLVIVDSQNLVRAVDFDAEATVSVSLPIRAGIQFAEPSLPFFSQVVKG